MALHQNFTNLEKNLIDMIKEAQLKLGYDQAPIRLYYPLASLNRLLGTSLGEAKMELALQEFSAFTQDTLGAVSATRKGDRFCLLIPKEGTAYVHEQVEDPAFLAAFLQTISRCPVVITDILDVFHRFSDRVHYVRYLKAEIDYMVCFEDGVPDTYRYCIHFDEDGCASYHRLTPEDFEALWQ